MLLEMVRVRYSNQSARSDATSMMEIEAARQLVEAGLALWSKGAKYLILTKMEAEMHRAAQSLTMGPNVTEQAADGSVYHMALVEAWRGFAA